MTSKHYRWQLRWRIDAQAQAAHHETGLMVQFCGPPGTGIGAPGHAINSGAVIDALTPKHGHNAPTMISRLMREAKEIYARPSH